MASETHSTEDSSAQGAIDGAEGHWETPSIDAPTIDQYQWLGKLAPSLRATVHEAGAVLIHGLPMRGPDDMAAARDVLGLSAHRPREHFARRQDLGNAVVSPIHWPNDRPLCPFQEFSFVRPTPTFVLTGCVAAPLDSEHHFSDTRRIINHLPPQLIERVRADGWVMKRVFHEGFGISWQDAFNVTDRAQLSDVLTHGGIRWEWVSPTTLRTSRHLAGVIDHVQTGDECWFNDLAFFNAASLDSYERKIMTGAFGSDLPVDTAFGDGSLVPETSAADIRAAYDAVKRRMRWRAGDLLIVDNLSTAQGRPARQEAPDLLVALAEVTRP